MATSNDEWDVGMQNGLRPSVAPPEHRTPSPGMAKGVGAIAPGEPKPSGGPGSLKPGQPAGQRPGHGGSMKPGQPAGQRPGHGGSMKPGQPGARPHQPTAPRPGHAGHRPGGPGTRPVPGTSAQIAGFEGMHLKLRKSPNGRYALGVDLELALDKAKSGGAKIPGGPGGKTGGTGPGGMKQGRPKPQAVENEVDDLEAFAVPDDVPDDVTDDLEAFAVSEEDDTAYAADEDQGDGETAYAADEDQGDGETAYAADEDQGDGETAYAADEDQGDGETAYAADEDQGDGGVAADDQKAGDDALAGEAESTGTAQWPNQSPVRKGLFAISQAPAIFETQDTEAEDEALAPQAATKPARRIGTVQGMLAAAKKTIGMGESPPKSDHNKITEWYNSHIARIGNGPWCDMAVTYWAGQSSNLPAIFAGKGVGFAYTVAHAHQFQKKGRWHAGAAGIKPGDIVFFDWNGSRSMQNIDHVGVVEKVSGKRIVTIEGNTTGDSCRRQVRDAKYIVGYGRPAYGK